MHGLGGPAAAQLRPCVIPTCGATLRHSVAAACPAADPVAQSAYSRGRSRSSQKVPLGAWAGGRWPIRRPVAAMLHCLRIVSYKTGYYDPLAPPFTLLLAARRLVWDLCSTAALKTTGCCFASNFSSLARRSTAGGGVWAGCVSSCCCCWQQHPCARARLRRCVTLCDTGGMRGTPRPHRRRACIVQAPCSRRGCRK